MAATRRRLRVRERSFHTYFPRWVNEIPEIIQTEHRRSRGVYTCAHTNTRRWLRLFVSATEETSGLIFARIYLKLVFFSLSSRRGFSKERTGNRGFRGKIIRYHVPDPSSFPVRRNSSDMSTPVSSSSKIKPCPIGICPSQFFTYILQIYLRYFIILYTYTDKKLINNI